MLRSIPDYGNLDLSGEARSAAERMEARAQELSSEALFLALVAPLLTPQVARVLDVGCGTAALARRIAKLRPDAAVLATDKSLGMLAVAERLAAQEGLKNLAFKAWDATDGPSFSADGGRFDLIVSSVMVVYLSEDQADALVLSLSQRLNPGGVLAFIEQDLMTDALNPPSDLALAVLDKDRRTFKRTQGLGLRSSLRKAGLELLPRRSHLWTDDRYGAYTRELLERFADAGAARGAFSAEEAGRFKRDLLDQATVGDFYYGLVYHRIAGRANKHG